MDYIKIAARIAVRKEPYNFDIYRNKLNYLKEKAKIENINLSEEGLKDAFKKAAKLHHPDMGGSTEVQRQLNEDIQYLKEYINNYTQESGRSTPSPSRANPRDRTVQTDQIYIRVINPHTLNVAVKIPKGHPLEYEGGTIESLLSRMRDPSILDNIINSSKFQGKSPFQRLNNVESLGGGNALVGNIKVENAENSIDEMKAALDEASKALNEYFRGSEKRPPAPSPFKSQQPSSHPPTTTPHKPKSGLFGPLPSKTLGRFR